MVVQVTVSAVFADFFCSMGLGLLLALFYEGMRFLLPQKKAAVFFCDFFTIVLGAVFTFSYGVSLSHSGVFRWYMPAGALTGYAACRSVLMPASRRLRLFVHHLLCLPFLSLKKYVFSPLRRKLQEKRRKSIKRRKKQLQKKGRILYNAK